MGWFNKGGFIPKIKNPGTFSTLAYDLQDGVNPPIASGDRWHVVEIQKRDYDRPMTFAESKQTAKNEMMPGFEKELFENYMLEARKSAEVVFLGVFAPGGGLSVDQLFAKARSVVDTERKLELFKMIYTDFPSSDRADDALFLSGNIVLDVSGDRRGASIYLGRLLREYPDSDLASDAQFILENMGNPNAMNPTSIEDLRK